MKLLTEVTLSDYIRNAPDAPATEPQVDTPGPDAPDAPATEPPVPAGKLLSFTVVHGWVRGDHRCPFELHATGCRDLRKLLRTNQFSYEVLAESREHAEAEARSEHGAGMVWTQPCCTLKRMKAIGRA
jgi:hypothetical protein